MAKRRILIAHGDAGVARQLRQRLVNLGYEVAGVASSQGDAMTLAAQQSPDVMLLGLPVDGDPISAEPAGEDNLEMKIPVVLILSGTEEPSIADTKVPDAAAYVVRPFTDRELRANVELALARHRAAKAMHDMEDRFFTNSIDLLCFLDFSGYFKRLNPAWERTLGFTRAELMSKPFIEFVHPDDRERTLNQNRDVRGGGQALSFENRYLCKDGTYRWLRWNATPDSSESVIYSVARDVTANKEAEEERERLVSELRAASSELRTLQAILPICSYCRKVRDDENYWHTVEHYISEHTSTLFSHSICPSCLSTRPELGNE